MRKLASFDASFAVGTNVVAANFKPIGADTLNRRRLLLVQELKRGMRVVLRAKDLTMTGVWTIERG